MINIPRGIPLPIENGFRDVNTELRALGAKINEADLGATRAELDSLRREVAKLTRKENDESWRDSWVFALGDISFGKDIVAGYQMHRYTPVTVKITAWTLVGDASGNIDIDLEVVNYANFGALSPVSICGSEPPTLAGVQKNQNLSIATWTPNVPAGSILSVNVTSASSMMQATLVLDIRRM